MIRLVKIQRLGFVRLSTRRYQSTETTDSKSRENQSKYDELKSKPVPDVIDFPDMDQYHVLHKGAYNKIKQQHKQEDEEARIGVPKDYIEENTTQTQIKIFEDGRPVWAQPELKKVSIFQKYLLWHFAKSFQSKYKNWREVPDYLPMVDRKTIQRIHHENPEKAKLVNAKIKADVIQKFAVGGMVFEIFGYYLMFLSITAAFVGSYKFNSWADEHIGKSSMSKSEFFKESIKVAWETSNLTDPYQLGAAFYRYNKTAKGTYNTDGTLNYELGKEHADFLFEQEPIVKKYREGLDSLVARTNIGKHSGGEGWMQEQDLEILSDMTKIK